LLFLFLPAADYNFIVVYKLQTTIDMLQALLTPK
jgi:hypothetical protein